MSKIFSLDSSELSKHITIETLRTGLSFKISSDFRKGYYFIAGTTTFMRLSFGREPL